MRLVRINGRIVRANPPISEAYTSGARPYIRHRSGKTDSGSNSMLLLVGLLGAVAAGGFALWYASQNNASGAPAVACKSCTAKPLSTMAPV